MSQVEVLGGLGAVVERRCWGSLGAVLEPLKIVNSFDPPKDGLETG